MKIWELDLTDGKQYKDQNGVIWIAKDGNLLSRNSDLGYGLRITTKRTLAELQNLDFEVFEHKIEKLKVWEIRFINGRRYVDDFDEIWTISDGELMDLDPDSEYYKYKIHDRYATEDILGLNFKPVCPED